MKYCMRFGILVIALLLSGTGFGQRKPKIKGNRSVIIVDKPLNEFAHLSITDGLEVRLEPGNKEAVRIEADDNLIDILRFEQDGDTLNISTFYTITGSKKLDLTLTYQDLRTIRVAQGSAVAEQTIEVNQLDLMLMEGSETSLTISAGLVKLQMSGNATSDLNIASDSLHITLADQTKSFIYSTDSAMDITLSGRATAVLEGTGKSLTLSMTDNASLKAEGMEVGSIMAFLNTSSQARINALTQLSYEGRDKSKLYVYGQPKIEILGFYDTAELHKSSQ